MFVVVGEVGNINKCKNVRKLWNGTTHTNSKSITRCFCLSRSTISVRSTSDSRCWQSERWQKQCAGELRWPVSITGVSMSPPIPLCLHHICVRHIDTIEHQSPIGNPMLKVEPTRQRGHMTTRSEMGLTMKTVCRKTAPAAPALNITKPFSIHEYKLES